MQINSLTHSARKNSGFNLIEMMLSITIGSFLIIGAAFAFQEAQKAYRVNDTVARLQEQAQFVLDTLEEDVRMANFWGLHNVTSAVQKDNTITALELSSGGISGDCDNNWALDVSLGIYGTNTKNPAQAPDMGDTITRAWGQGCITTADFEANTDTLVVLHAGNNIVASSDLKAGKVYVSSNETPQSIMFTGTAVPSAASSIDKIFELRSHGYYVRNYSFEDNNGDPLDSIPMLRRITLIGGSTAPAVQDREISSGVQDFQVEFGIDTSPIGSSNRGSINRYVSPDSSILVNGQSDYNPDARILSVRVWILMQALNEEQNFNNTDTYSYAGINTVANDSYRRLLVSRTFQVRNMVRTSVSGS